MLNTSISYGRKILSLAKIYMNNTKYSSHNNSFIFKFAISYNIFSKANILLWAKIMIYPTLIKVLILDNYDSNISTSAIVLILTKSIIRSEITLKKLNISKIFS